MKINGSWKFILTALAVLGLITLGMRTYSWLSLRNFELTPTKAKEVNLVAIQPGKGFRVIVANRIAQLGEVEETEDGRGGFGGGDVQNAQNLRRIPVRELLGSLNTDPKDAGYLIERMNELNGPDDPVSEYQWQEEDLVKALDGDPVLRRKLEIDLQCTLDGAPIDSFSPSRIYSGISIVTKVPIKVLTGDSMVTVQALVRQPYKSRLAGVVEKELNERFNLTQDQMLNAYLTKGAETPIQENSVANALRSRISPNRKQDLASKPERIVGSAMVLANTEHFLSASTRSYKAGNNRDELTDLTLKMTDEGRKRLWKYSQDKVKSGFQLMFVVDGVAVAAPRITTELAESEIKITQMPDRPLAESSAEKINSLKKK